VRQEVRGRFKARGERITIVNQTLGYELRSADPTPNDMSYCRSLGHGAIRLLMNVNGDVPNGVMVTIANGDLHPMSFADMTDPATKRTRVRLVNTTSYAYQVARAYQIRLEWADIEDPVKLTRLAAVAHMSPEDFKNRYAQAASRLAEYPDE